MQGFTELPAISSSGHLILVPSLAHWRFLETHESFNKTFDVALHLRTMEGRANLTRELLTIHRSFHKLQIALWKCG